MIDFLIGLIVGIILSACIISDDIRKSFAEDFKKIVSQIKALFKHE